METICLGWDVGGWHGGKDALAALALSDDGTIRRVGSTVRLSLGPVIAERGLTLRSVAQPIGLDREIEAAERVIVGVDAPFGFPVQFQREVGADLASAEGVGGPLPDDYIDNPLAYRESDRAVFSATDKRPLSPSFDKLTNNITKTRAALSQLVRHHSDLRVVPFQQDSTRCAVVEVYPALWESARDGDSLDRSLVDILADFATSPTDDERDALLSALAAAAYECARTGRDSSFPDVLLPPDGEESVREEGWIYGPVTKSR